MDLGDWHPRIGVPRTKGLGEQKIQGLKGVLRWYYERLQEGTLTETDAPPVLNGTPGDWGAGSLKVAPGKIMKEYADWLHYRNPHEVVTGKTVISALGKFGWDSGDHLRHGKGRDRYYDVPRLVDARKAFSAKLGFDPFAG